MSQLKIKVVHFHNGTGGGVLSVIRNLLAYRQHPEIENHVIYTINREQIPVFNAPGLVGAASEQVFYYSPQWNFYHTCRQLAKLLPGQDAVIVAHDWLELGMVSNIGLQNPVVQILHGDFDYYYNLALLHSKNVDEFICVSPVIEKKLTKKLPSGKISYLRFPVPEVKVDSIQTSPIKIAFFVRDLSEERKQMKLLPLIEKELTKNGLFIEWHLAGSGMTKEQLAEAWEDSYSERILFWGELDRRGVDQLLRECNVMILPSLSEGFPVAVVEAMKYGLIPLVSYWDGAVSDLVIDGLTGYCFEKQDAVSYAKRIMELAADSAKMQVMSSAALQASSTLFAKDTNTSLFEDLFISISTRQKRKISFKAYGSRLDHSLLPNVLVYALRSISAKLFAHGT